MKVIKERTIKIKYVVPETEEEEQEIKKIIKEVTEEKVDPAGLKKMKAGQPVEE